MKQCEPSNPMWRMIESFPKYEISTTGQIRNCLSGKILKIQHRSSGISYVIIRDKDGIIRTPHIEDLVAKVFLPNKDSKNKVLKHLDGNINNCAVENLVWVEDHTAQERLQVPLNKPKEYFAFYPMIEFPDSIYEINKMGQVRNKNTHKILKGGLRDGYLCYTLLINKKIVFRPAHLLVARQFIPNPYNKTIVNHIDENRANPCVDNLEWVTPSENSKHGTARERANIGRNKPINEYNTDGKYIRTWKSIKMISTFLDSLYPRTDNNGNIQRAVIINAKKSAEKVLVANRVFIRYEGHCDDIKFAVKKARPRAYKDFTLEGINVPKQFLYDEIDSSLDFVSVLKAIKEQNPLLTAIQKRAIDYAIECIEKIDSAT